MDINQLARMIEWLDEERRRDKTTIATLEERLAQQSETINTLQRRLGGVESDQSMMKEQTLPADREQEMMDTLRAEMRKLLENSESRRINAEREGERRAEIQRENQQRNLQQLTERLNKLERSTGTIGEVRTEGSRLADSHMVLQQRVDDLEKKLDEPDRRLSFLEEQRRQDARRLSEVESELPELKKQTDSVRPKLSLVEELALKNERRVQEVTNAERERREQIQQFIDQQSLINQQRDSQVEDLIRRFNEQDNEIQGHVARFETWAQAYREMKRIIDDFERIGDRLERRINEVAEMQRLSEERFRQEWNDWRDEDQKRWKQLTLSNDDVWRNHDKEFQLWTQRLEAMQNSLPALRDSLARLWNLERERAAMYRDRYQTLLMEYDTGGTSSTNEAGDASHPNGHHSNGNGYS